MRRNVKVMGQTGPCTLRIGQDGIYRPVSPNETSRQIQLAELRARSPSRTPAPQRDAGHLPLFIAANEPLLL